MRPPLFLRRRGVIIVHIRLCSNCNLFVNNLILKINMLCVRIIILKKRKIND